MSRKSKALQFQDTGYNINVTGRHMDITDAMKNYAMEKIFKIEKFTDRIIDVSVCMDIQKIEHKVDIFMSIAHLKIKSSASTTDMYVSIDQAVDKLEKQLLKYKDRLHDYANKDLAAVDMRVNVLRREDAEITEINDEIESENNRSLMEGFGNHFIMKTESKPLKNLTTEEAIMKLDLSGEHFLIYRSEEDRKLKVIYRRNDDTLGIIEVES